MGKLKLGDITELSERTKRMEERMEDMQKENELNVAQLADNTRRIDEHGSSITGMSRTKVIKGNTFIKGIPDLDLTGID